ncbi:ATP-binding cassette domain-containing protein [Pelagibius litoralis]|uniref:ATP-binding cassette domain-containing protein n=1 Tax=Pelagibius litoralis TaxID=374515 RepID=A0A967EXQ0_9PROT|nr:ATP-binding cassette domain-containing protein [Pelagibius litoralis]NIA69336.1 ATP-binding cassette domain-containing protein [Pelagibius litoralis]
MPEVLAIDFGDEKASPPAILLDDVVLERGGKAVIDRLSLPLGPKGVTAFMGPNGAGKSLTLRLIAGLIAPTAGRIRFAEGVPLPQQIALVFQKPVLLRRSVRANLDHALKTFGTPRRERPARLADLLALGQLEPLAERPARVLSGGEQQRVAMVRALAANPKYLLLDEPTASLDPQATAAIETLVARAVAAGVRVILVTHDRGQAGRLADDICFLHKGRLLEAAPAARFFQAPKTAEAKAYLAGDLLL